MSQRFAAFRDRPLAEQERPMLLLAVAVVLTASALLLAITRPTAGTHPHRLGARHHTLAAQGTGATLSPAAARVCERFLAGYLAYLYGHAPAAVIRDAAPPLLHTLERDELRVSPAMRAAHPRLLKLTSNPAGHGQFAVSALINDGALIDYRIGLLLTVSGGRLRVSAVEAD